MDLGEKFNNKWNDLKKTEKSAIKVLLILLFGVIIFALGIEIGKVFYLVIGK
jgi:hypothetical protein